MALTTEEENMAMESEDDRMMDSDDEEPEGEEPKDESLKNTVKMDVSVMCHNEPLKKVWKMAAPHAKDGKSRERKTVFKEIKALQTKLPYGVEEIDAEDIIKYMHAQDMEKMIKVLQHKHVKRLKLGDVGRI